MKGETLFLTGVKQYGSNKLPYQFEIIDNDHEFVIRCKGINTKEIKDYLCELVDNAQIINY